jgi:hypothetical protein
MSTVTLQVQHPDGSTKAFELTEHDTFLLGRMKDCHLCLPDDTHAVYQFKREMAVIAKLQHPHNVRFLGSARRRGHLLLRGTNTSNPSPASGASPPHSTIDIILNENPVPIRDRLPAWKNSSPPPPTNPSSEIPKTASRTRGNC